MKEKKDKTIREIHGQGAKAVFEDPILCAEFLRDEGKIEGVKSCVIDFLQELGEIPEELTSRINSETDVNILKQWLKLAAKTQTIDEFENRITGNN